MAKAGTSGSSAPGRRGGSVFLRLGGFVAYRRRLVLGLFALVVVTAGGLGFQLFPKLQSGGFNDPGSESAHAEAVLANRFDIRDPGDLREATVDYLLERREARARSLRRSAAATGTSVPRENSKTMQVIAMLKRPEGTTVEEIMEKMGWLKHTTRAMLSAGGSLVKKHGLLVTSEKMGETRRYYIKD